MDYKYPIFTVENVLRPMPGGSYAQLVQTGRRVYVMKCKDNPQGTLTLAHDLFCTRLASALGISVPEALPLYLPDELANKISFTVGDRRIRVQAGLQFGSRYPGDPARVAVFHKLSAQMQDAIGNRSEWGAIFAFDRWTRQRDSRQFLIYRASTGPKALRYLFYDFGQAFGTFDSHLLAVCPDRQMYTFPDVLSHCREQAATISAFPDEVIETIAAEIPGEWISSDPSYVSKLIDMLVRRKLQLPDLVEHHLRLLLHQCPSKK